MEPGIVHIVDMGGDSRSFILAHCHPLTAREVISAFYDIPPRDVEIQLQERSFKIVERGALMAEDLDDALSNGDTITVYSYAVARSGIRGEVCLARFDGLTIDMCYNEPHLLPHIHVNRHSASISLEGELLAGSLQTRKLSKVASWIRMHNRDLRRNWARRLRGQSIIPVGPWT